MTPMLDHSCLIMPSEALGMSRDWLQQQPFPVVAYGNASMFADVVVATQREAEAIAAIVEQYPIAALTLVQVLRVTESLSPLDALDVESMAYATLQGGAEFKQWRSRHPVVEKNSSQDGPCILLERQGNELLARLNRPKARNSMTIEMRDAWVEMLNVLEHDSSITRLSLEACGKCFSVGGELSEFGSRPDTAIAHWVRTVQSPARLMALHGSKVEVCLHGACIGSGIELSAFARSVSAHPRSFFQLPELAMGLIPGSGGTVSIARRIGRQRMAWLVLSGRRIGAQTALKWGLVDKIE